MAQGPNPVPHDPEGDTGVVCATCGRVRPSAEVCGCGQGGGPTVPAGWDPALTRTSRPRLPLTAPTTAGSGRAPEPADRTDGADGADGADREGPPRHPGAQPDPADARDTQT